MTINKRIIISSIVPVIQHGRQGLCRFNLTGMVANYLYSTGRVPDADNISAMDVVMLVSIAAMCVISHAELI